MRVLLFFIAVLFALYGADAQAQQDSGGATSITEKPQSGPLHVSNIMVLDASERPVSEIEQNQRLYIMADIKNNDSSERRFVYALVPEGGDGDYMSGSIQADQRITAGIIWVPKTAGEHTVMIRVGPEHASDYKSAPLRATLVLDVDAADSRPDDVAPPPVDNVAPPPVDNVAPPDEPRCEQGLNPVDIRGRTFCLEHGAAKKIDITETVQSHSLDVSDIRIVNAFGEGVSEIEQGQRVHIAADIHNTEDHTQHYVYLIVSNDTRESSISGDIPPGRTASAALSWIPKTAGEHTVLVSAGTSHDSLTLRGTVVLYIGSTADASLSSRQQIANGVSPDKIQCRDDLNPVIIRDRVACLKESSIQSLTLRGVDVVRMR